MKVSGTVDYQLGSFDYGFEKRNRVIRVRATLVRGSRSKSPRIGATPISLRSARGGYDPLPTDTEKGHLIALEYGGEDREENLVPMWGYFNRGGSWRQLEAELDLLCRTTHSGLDLRIDCKYAGTGDQRIPEAFQVTAMYRVGSGPRTSKTWLLTHRRLIYQARDIVAPMDTVDSSLHGRTLIEEVVPFGTLALWLFKYERRMRAEGWTLEAEMPLTNSGQRYYLADHRPYAILDYLAFRGILRFNHSSKVDKTQKFTADQRNLVLQVNLLRNGWTLRSDDPEDPHPALTVRGSHAGAEVDHIIPRSLSGMNAFSNAQVVSRQHNSAKRAKLEAEDLERTLETRREGKRKRRPVQRFDTEEAYRPWKKRRTD